jgi:hypothetical protein
MFRFTIRELVLLTLVVAMGVAWWAEHRQIVQLQSRCGRLEKLAANYVEVLRDNGFDASFNNDSVEIIRGYYPPESAPWKTKKASPLP